MNAINDSTVDHYANSRKLAARARLSGGFSTAEIPWFSGVAQQFPVTAGARVLDVGCGPAWFWAEAIEDVPRGIDLALFDQSAGMIAEAIERCRVLPLASVAGQVGDAAELPFADESFDGLIAMHMLYHLRDPAAAIAEFHRVLKPGGILLVTTNGIQNMQELYRLTTVFGSPPQDPSALAFGFERATELIEARFGHAELAVHPATMRVTEPDVVYDALTSYPPGETAPPDQQAAFRSAIDAAFAQGAGGITVTKQVGLVRARKAG